MKPTVINIRDAPSGWEHNDQFVYIGRAGKGLDGYFGNPVVKGNRCLCCGEVHYYAGETLTCYEKWLTLRLQVDAKYAARVQALAGKTLVCFCKPLACHGDILAQACAGLNA